MKLAHGPGCQGDTNQLYGNHCGSKWSCGRNIAEGDSCPFHCGVGARQGGCLGDSRNNDNGGIACPQCNCHDPACRKNNGYLFHKEADDLCAFVDDLTDTSDVAQPIDDIDSCCAAHDFCCRDPIMANGQKLFAGQEWSWRYCTRTVRQPSSLDFCSHAVTRCVACSGKLLQDCARKALHGHIEGEIGMKFALAITGSNFYEGAIRKFLDCM